MVHPKIRTCSGKTHISLRTKDTVTVVNQDVNDVLLIVGARIGVVDSCFVFSRHSCREATS